MPHGLTRTYIGGVSPVEVTLPSGRVVVLETGESVEGLDRDDASALDHAPENWATPGKAKKVLAGDAEPDPPPEPDEPEEPQPEGDEG